MKRRTHIIDPEHFVATERERPWCGMYGARYSPLVEHPADADCAHCLARWRAWEREQVAS